MQTKSLVTINSDDFSKILKQIEEKNKGMNLNLDLDIHRDHIIDEKGSRQECHLLFKGILTPQQKSDFEKFKEEVHKLIEDSDHSVKFDVKFEEPKKTHALGLKEEEEANRKLTESHNRMKEHLHGISQPMIRLTSKRTYSSKDGEKFSGDLYIGGDCPEDLKENFIKYYNEVAKPLPEDYKRNNQARLKSDTSSTSNRSTAVSNTPQITCSICKNSLDEKPSYFANKAKGANADVKICSECVDKESELERMSQSGPIVLVPKKNEIRRQERRRSNEVSIFDDPFLREFERPFSHSLMPEFDRFSHSLMPEFDRWNSWMEPLNSRFREFERIADRLDRRLRESFRDMMFPFES